MSRGHLTSSDLSDGRAEVVITRRDPNLAKPDFFFFKSLSYLYEVVRRNVSEDSWTFRNF